MKTEIDKIEEFKMALKYGTPARAIEELIGNDYE